MSREQCLAPLFSAVQYWVVTRSIAMNALPRIRSIKEYPMSKYELIAYRCKKNISPQCPSARVRFSIGPFPKRQGEPISYFNIVTEAPELNAICEVCENFEHEHDKPLEMIALGCQMARTGNCPDAQVNSSRLMGRLRIDSPLLDEICRPCRLYEPMDAKPLPPGATGGLIKRARHFVKRSF